MKNKALLISVVLMLFLLVGAVSASGDMDATINDNMDGGSSDVTPSNDDGGNSDIPPATDPDNGENSGNGGDGNSGGTPSTDGGDGNSGGTPSTDAGDGNSGGTPSTDAGDGKSSENPSTDAGDGNSGETPSADDGTANHDANQSVDVATSFKCSESNIVKGKYFYVTLVDANGNALANKIVQFKLDKAVSKVKTNSKGIAKLLINVKEGTHTVSYSFSETGFKSSEGSKSILVISTSTSKFLAKSYVAYVNAKNIYSITLKVGNLPLSKRTVKFTINGKTYTKKTNAKGKAYLDLNLKKGVYTLKCTYDGEKNIKKSSVSVKVTVKKGMPVTIKKANSVYYRHLTTAPFKVKVVDARGKLLTGKKVVFVLNKKKYTRTVDKKGIATLNIHLKKGTYNIKVYTGKTSVYSKASKTFKVKIASYTRSNGFWLFGMDMKSVDLNKMKKYHINQIFLNAKALELYGKSGVEKWIKSANSRGIKVHIWMQVFYGENGWISPVTKDGSYKYNVINSKVNLAKQYAKIKGVAGVHFDYLRFPGTAHNYKNGVDAVNYFTKKACDGIHKINSKLIVSAAVMPEPDSMKYYYGQDIPTLSKSLDVIVPMVYKGNYNAGTNWINKITKIFVKQSKKAKIWTGLQSYRSDSNVAKLSASELLRDSNAASSGGAYGVIMFRYGLFNYFDFNRI